MLIVMPCANLIPDTKHPMAEYTAIARALAAQTGSVFLDLQPVFGATADQYSASSARPLLIRRRASRTRHERQLIADAMVEAVRVAAADTMINRCCGSLQPLRGSGHTIGASPHGRTSRTLFA